MTNYKILKETNKALRLESDSGRIFWIQKRWACKRTEKEVLGLTPAGLKAESEGKTAEELEKAKWRSLPVSWENDKAIGVDFRAEFTLDPTLSRTNQLYPLKRRLFFPKSQLNQAGQVPIWLYNSKVAETNIKLKCNEGKQGYEIVGLWVD